MKKAIIILLIFILLACKNKAATKPPNYDLLMKDLQTLAKVEGTVILFNPENMKIDYIFNPDMAISQAFEPGSIFKIITSMVYFYKHPPFLYTSNGKFLVYPGDRGRPRRKVSSRTRGIRPGDYFPDGGSCPRGEVRYEEALATSSNSYFLYMMRGITFRNWLKFAGRVGFGQTTGIKYPVNNNVNNNETTRYIYEANGLMKFRTRFNRLMCAIGLGPKFNITPIQYAVFLASLFNNGKIMKPILGNEEPVLKLKYKLPKRMNYIYNAMKKTVDEGTGVGFKLDVNAEIFSKTGSTMQHKRPWKPNGWFVGVIKLKKRNIGFVSFFKNRHSTAAKRISAVLLRHFINNIAR